MSNKQINSDEHVCTACCEHCCHDEKQEGKLTKVLLLVSVILIGASFIPMNSILNYIVMGVAVLLAAYPIIMTSFKNIAKFNFTETELMLIAIVAACCLGEFREAAAVAILYRIGEMLEDRAVEKSRKSIESVSKIQQDFAHSLLEDGSLKKVPAEQVKVGTKIMVLPYEIYPIDGLIYSGISTADASAITGESMPITVCRGVEVKSGMINGKDSVTVVTTEKFENSTASRIVKMVEDATEKKGKTQKTITKIARIYTPIVVILAVLIAIIPSIIYGNTSEWIYRALVFLVASCPCALVISVPLGFFTGLGTAAKNGIVVKGSIFIEAFAKARAVVFDKTGTLTTDNFEVDKIHPLGEFTQEQVLTLAAAAEHFSSHPIAKSIATLAPRIDESQLSQFSEIAGNGAAVTFSGKRILCGSKRLLSTNNIDVSSLPENEICVAIDSIPIGSIALKNTIRDGAADMIDKLKLNGVERAIMLTGDNEVAAEAVARDCDIDEYYCNLLPEDKLSHLEEIKKDYGKVIYVGDGINDAPVLAAADAGVAMGLGTQAASEAADIILTNNKLEKLSDAQSLFKRTYNVVLFNIVFSIAVKAIVLILGALGYAPVWLAVFADVGVCLICVLVASAIGAQKYNLLSKNKTE